MTEQTKVPEDTNGTRNHRFERDGDYGFKSILITPDELAFARAGAQKLLDIDPQNYMLRSCWQCNSSHVKFLEGEWNSWGKTEWLLKCFECGRLYYKKIDITEYEPSAE